MKKVKNRLEIIAYEMCAARLNRLAIRIDNKGCREEIEDYGVEGQREELVDLIEEIAWSLREKADELR